MNSHFDLPRALCLTLLAAHATFAGPSPTDAIHFEQHVRPLLEAKCLKCHGDKKQEGHLRLDSRGAILKGGDSGPAIVAGQPDKSLLIEAVKYQSLAMPPAGELAPEQIEHLITWIAGGAVWPDDVGQLRESTSAITAEDREWWAFQPLTKPVVPRTASDEWSRTPIDRFIVDRLAQADLRPAPQADSVTLVRRLYFDLIGLPPTPEEIDAYVSDPSPRAWNNLVEKLLADHRYGEHWSRFWLDLVRYAESDGWKADSYRPHMWRYRDYVVDAFNEDKPYPRFVKEQLAGDELPGDDPEALAAAGFLRLGIYEYNQRNARTHWSDILNEITDVTGDVFLGMGMACARCHDHKFDPILQRDYFQLRAFFEPLLWEDHVVQSTGDVPPERDRQQAEWSEATEQLRTALKELTQPYYDRIRKTVVEKFPLDIQACYFKPEEERTTWDHQMAYLIERQVADEGGGPRKLMSKDEQAEYDRLLAELAAFDHLKPPPVPVVMTVTDAPGRLAPTLLPDGSSGMVVEPGFLTVMSGDSTSDAPAIAATENSSGRRTALAEWIGRGDNPLTMRVFVNRIWKQHFGEGIVATTNDFGHLGQAPTHPELLDWLTVAFIERGWSMKDMHRLILNSAVWQQSSEHPDVAECERADPAGDLLWRWRVRRLRAEQIRDAMLTATGELQSSSGGPSVDAASPTRALYVKVFRNTPDELLHVFDMANGLKSVAARDSTTTPTQSLLLINGGYAVERAEALSQSLREEGHATMEEFLTEACRRTWNRSPTSQELAASLAFVGATADQVPSTVDEQHLTDFCHVLLNSSEFLYVD